MPTPTVTTINAAEVAAMLGIHRSTVYECAARGELPCRRLGRRFIFTREGILDWLRQCEIAPVKGGQ